MYVKSATLADLPAIQQLLSLYGGIFPVGPELFNKRDIALQARAEDGKLVGFIWCGLMAKNSLAYVDTFVVNPDLSGQGVGMALLTELRTRLLKVGIKRVFGTIKQGEYHDKSAMDCLKVGMGALSTPYTVVFAEVGSA